MIWALGLPEPSPSEDPDEPNGPGSNAEPATIAEPEPPEPVPDEGEDEAHLPTAVEAPTAAIVLPVQQERVDRAASRKKGRPHPLVTLIVFLVGVATGAGIFVTRMQPPPIPETLPVSPYGVLNGGPAPLGVAVLMDGLTSGASMLPSFVPDPALTQLKRVTEPFAVIASVEHQGTVVVGNKAVSALVIRGRDHQGRETAVTLTCLLVDNRIQEFR